MISFFMLHGRILSEQLSYLRSTLADINTKTYLKRIKKERKTKICVDERPWGMNEKVIAIEFSFTYIRTSKI